MLSRPLRRIGRATWWLVLFLGITSGVFGQAVLESGPVNGRGLYFLYPNAVEYSRATYALQNGTVDVYYTEQAISVEDGWGSYQCGPETLRQYSFRGETVLYAEQGEDYILFFVAADLPEGFCGFYRQFLSDFSYFRSAVGTGESVPFPAVLGIR